MWMRVCVGSRGRDGGDEEEGTSEHRKHFRKVLLCLGGRAMSIIVLKVGKAGEIFQV